MKQVLIALVGDIQATGGLIQFSDGLVAPKAEPSWTDLGSTVLMARDELQDSGHSVKLDIDVVDYPADQIADHI